MPKDEKELSVITITRATVVNGVGRVERGKVMIIGANITLSDARLLIGIKKAVKGEVKFKAEKQMPSPKNTETDR